MKTVSPGVILIGRNDADALGAGWHPVQDGPGGVPCRWMSPRADVRMPIEGSVNGGRTRVLYVTVSAPALIQNKKPGLSVYIGEKLLGHCSDLGDEGLWNAAIIDFDDGAEINEDGAGAASIVLTLAIENHDGETPVALAFIPHVVTGNGDLRELGALVASVRWI